MEHAEGLLNDLNEILLGFSRLEPESKEEAIYFLTKAKLILDEYLVYTRLKEKEPLVAKACFERILEHIDNYKRRYAKEEYAVDEDDFEYDEEEDDLFAYEDDEEDDTDEPFLEEDPWLECEDDAEEENNSEEEDFNEILTLNDTETGEVTDFYLLDVLYAEDEESNFAEFYAVLPVNPKTEDDEGALMFLRVEENDDDTATYYGVNNQDLAYKLLEQFKEENQDRYHFEI